MRLDILGELDSAHALTSGTTYSTNTIDLTNVTPKRDMGTGEELEVVITVDVAATTSNGDETYTFDFVQSVNANLSSDDILVSMPVPRATLVAGYKVHLPVSKSGITKRYIGVKYVLGGTGPTITVSSHVIPASFAEALQVYAKNYTVA